MNGKKILLVTSTDDAYRRPLLEAQGYAVRKVGTLAAAGYALTEEDYSTVLLVSEGNLLDILSFCSVLKGKTPRPRTALLAGFTENVPNDAAVDAVIRTQHSPGKFLAMVRILTEMNGGGRRDHG
jgi:hypothetical protein